MPEKRLWTQSGHEITMPSPMEGSSREGDLFTVKHELKNGKLAASCWNSKAVQFIWHLSFEYTCPQRYFSWASLEEPTVSVNGRVVVRANINVTQVQKWQRKANAVRLSLLFVTLLPTNVT